MTQHTPGPWVAKREHVCDELTRCRKTDKGFVATPEPRFASFVQPLGLQVYGPDWRHGEHDKPESDYICANARLIAAAPELLEAAKETTEYLAGPSTPECRMKVLVKLLRAIAKAEGKELDQ